MSLRLSLASMAFALITLMGLPASAGERVPFTAESLAAAQNEGKSIIVDVHASWCSTCKAQKAALTELGTLPDYKGVVVFEIDFDKQKDAWKALGVQTRSTLIAFKGTKETGRLVADTKKESIEALVKGSL